MASRRPTGSTLGVEPARAGRYDAGPAVLPPLLARFPDDYPLQRDGYRALAEGLVNYGLVVLAMLAGTLLWVTWNVRHYGARNQRTRQPRPVGVAEVAEFAGVREAEIAALQAARHMLVTFDEQDRLEVRTRT